MVGRAHWNVLAPYPDFLFPAPTFCNIDLIKRVHAPVLILFGSVDQMIPSSHPKEIYASANAPKRIVELKNFGHGSFATADDAKAYTNAVKGLVSGQIR